MQRHSEEEKETFVTFYKSGLFANNVCNLFMSHATHIEILRTRTVRTHTCVSVAVKCLVVVANEKNCRQEKMQVGNKATSFRVRRENSYIMYWKRHFSLQIMRDRAFLYNRMIAVLGRDRSATVAILNLHRSLEQQNYKQKLAQRLISIRETAF